MATAVSCLARAATPAGRFIPSSPIRDYDGRRLPVILPRTTPGYRSEPACPGVGSDPVPNRELVVLGTASQTPTRTRNHNGYLLRWETDGLLFDPGEGTQRQMLFAGVTASQITRICITHFHGDHCLGLPGVLARISLDRVPHPVDIRYPAESGPVFRRLRHAALSRDGGGTSGSGRSGRLASWPAHRRSAWRLVRSAQRGGLRLPAGRTGRAADAAGQAARLGITRAGRRPAQAEGRVAARRRRSRWTR